MALFASYRAHLHRLDREFAKCNQIMAVYAAGKSAPNCTSKLPKPSLKYRTLSWIPPVLKLLNPAKEIDYRQSPVYLLHEFPLIATHDDHSREIARKAILHPRNRIEAVAWPANCPPAEPSIDNAWAYSVSWPDQHPSITCSNHDTRLPPHRSRLFLANAPVSGSGRTCTPGDAARRQTPHRLAE